MCGKGSQTTTQQTSQTQTPNPQAMSLYQNILNQAQGVAATPYTPYGGELVAPVNQQQGMGISNINQYQPAYQTALGMAYNAAQPITGSQIAQYESPYTQQVVNATQAQFNNQNAQQQQQVLGNAAAQGALGGNRVGIAQAELANQQQLAQAPVIANLQNQGYMTGLNTALTEQQALGQGAYGVANMANAGLGGANAQIGAGTLQQQTQQAQDTAAYQQYLNQLGYPFQTTQWLAGIGTGVGSQMGGTTSGYGTTTGPPPSTFGQLAGGLTSGVGLLGASGAFGASGWLMPALAALARGGAVPSFANGGGVAEPAFASIPESPHTLCAQQRQLVSGDRHIQMFPHDTPELPLPSGMKRVHSHSGTFHYNPKHVKESDIHKYSRGGHEHVLLGLGPFSKEHILHRITSGEHPVAIVERNEHGHEVRAALGTHATAHIQHEHMSRGKSKNHTIHIEHPHKVLSERMDHIRNRQSGGGVSNYQLFGSGYGQPTMPYTGGSSFVPGIGITPGHTIPPAMQPPPAAGQTQQSGMSPQTMKNFAGLAQTFQGLNKQDNQGAQLAGLTPPPSDSTDYEDEGNTSSEDESGMENVDWDNAYNGGQKRGGAVNGIANFQDGGGESTYDDNAPYDVASLPPTPDVPTNGVAGGQSGLQSDLPVPLPKARPTDADRTVDVEGRPLVPDQQESVPTPTPQNAPRGMRNNNPGNIEDGPFARNQPGYTGSDGRFAQFDTMANGQAATNSLLGSYGDKGINTLSGIINRWAPAADNNDTNAYIRAVSKATGYSPDEPLDMKDPTVLSKISSAIHAHENGMPGGVLPNYMAGDYQRAYGALDIPRSQQATARAQVPEGVAPPDRWGSNNPLWESLIGAGAGMLSSRSPFAGVAIGEGLQQGLGTYEALHQAELTRGMNQQKIDQEANKLAELADYHDKMYRVNLMRAGQENISIVPGYETQDGHPVIYDKRHPNQLIDAVTQKPVDQDTGLKNIKFQNWKNSPMVTESGDPVQTNAMGQMRNASTGEYVGPGTNAKVVNPRSAPLSNEQLQSRGAQLAGGDVRGAMNGLGYAQSQQKQQVYEEALRQLTTVGGLSPQDAGRYLSAQMQEFNARGSGLTAESRTAATREANLKIILRAADAAIPAALEQSDKVGRTGFVPLNQLIQKGQVMTSNPELLKFGMANLQLAEHWARAMNPTGVMREEDRDYALRFLSTATSPEAYRAAVGQLKTQIDRELTAVQGFRKANGADATIGRPDGLTYDQAKGELRNGAAGVPTKPAQPNAAPAAPGTAPPPAQSPAVPGTQPAPKEGDRRQFKQGWGVYRNGQWVPETQ